MQTKAAHIVFLPLIKSLDVDGYLMYPGKPLEPGLHHSFRPGVNVVIGVNGLGKTTLLRMILRLLTGPRDLRAGDELGGTQRELSKAIDRAEFARKVPDQAKDSIARLEFELGGRTIVVARSMKDLSLVSFSVDPDLGSLLVAEDQEEQYEAAITQLSNVVSFYDFVFVLRHVVFFLEDRRGLVWDRWAQTELLQMLFLTFDFQTKYRDALKEALSADSSARNTQAVLTKEKKRLASLITNAADMPQIELNLLRATVLGLKGQIEEFEEQIDQLDHDRREQRRLAEARRQDTATLAKQERDLREAALAQLFPTLPNYGATALSYMQRGQGCIVCGTTDRAYLEQATTRWLSHEHCPVCDSPPILHEERPSPATQGTQLAELAVNRKAMQAAADDAEQRARAANQLYIEVLTKRDKLVLEHHEKADQLRVREAALRGISPDNITAQDERVKVLEETVSDYRSSKRKALLIVEQLMQALRGNIEFFQLEMCRSFNDLIKNFLAEDCILSYREVSRKIGQLSDDVDIPFPEFVVHMTSGVFKLESEIRETPDAVSESQREFIELAFRMALLSVALNDSPSTMIFDTPEASLDAVFIPRAGNAFHLFATHGAKPRVLFASSNLNGTTMIPSMLHITPQSPSASEDRSRIINLIAIAAKGRAMTTYSKEYDVALNNAIGGGP